MKILNNRFAKALTVMLLIQGVGFYAAERRKEYVPAVRPLTEFPSSVSDWKMVRDTPVEKEIQDVLRADDTLSRMYVDPSRTLGASLFIAFFKTQRTGQSPHSPKNCLPGSGWEPSETGNMTVNIPGSNPITINRYLVARGDEKSAVLYWYQSHSRVIASETWARIWLVADSIRYQRSDTALVRIVVPIRNNDVDGAVKAGVNFVQVLFPELQKQLPA